MQAEILGDDPDSKIRIFAVNPASEQAGNAFVEGAIPLLQESAGKGGPWRTWKPTYRDVVILDGQNRRVGAFNLTEHDLGDPAEYDALLTLLRDAAGESGDDP